MLNKSAYIFQFLPLSLFSIIAFWQPQTSNQTWLVAFQVSALVALTQLLLIAKQKIVLSRLILSANLYLIFGGLASFFQQWWYLQLYNTLQESAIFILMIIIAMTTMIFSQNSFIGINKSAVKDAKERDNINRKSVYLFITVLVSLAISCIFKGDIAISVAAPLVVLALFQRYLSHPYR
ncbi:MAG: hypothetical protein QF552_07550 [Litorilituus sp.]|jgi:hypothetical protein|nr:hypothetical protein [Litorilituus sp.]